VGRLNGHASGFRVSRHVSWRWRIAARLGPSSAAAFADQAVVERVQLAPLTARKPGVPAGGTADSLRGVARILVRDYSRVPLGERPS
jgi:hypothetical protein